MFPSPDLEDGLEGPPTRDSLAPIYGRAFANLACDEILDSYPALAWQREMGVPEDRLLGLIYPWFFPHARCHGRADGESAGFHAAARQSGEQHILYPDKGGFGAFIEGIVSGIDQGLATVHTGMKDLQCRMNPESLQVASIECDGETVTADHYFWCAPITGLAKLAGWDVPILHPQKLALGSYSFDREVACLYHEILVGDPTIPIGRISFPGRIVGGRNNLVQIEHLYPAGFREPDPRSWHLDSLAALRRLGIVTCDAQVEEYIEAFEYRGFVSVEDLPATVESYRTAFAQVETNLHVPHIGLGPENINRVVPSVFRTVYEAITN